MMQHKQHPDLEQDPFSPSEREADTAFLALLIVSLALLAVFVLLLHWGIMA